MENEPEHPELSLTEAVKALLIEEDLSDLTLQGDDVFQIKVNRCLVAIRIALFRRILYGTLPRQSSLLWRLDTVEVLKAIVQYIYTDTDDILRSETS
jgi:hypothetical protein